MREIVALPALTSLEETPDYIAGAVDWRGRMVAVIDLNRRFKHTSLPYRVQDTLLILAHGKHFVGIIVEEVRNVQSFAEDTRTPVPDYGVDSQLDIRFLDGLIQSNAHVIMVLHLENLLYVAQTLEAQGQAEQPLPAEGDPVFSGETSPQEREIFQQRAAELALSQESEERNEATSLIVLRIGEEYFGVELPAIREFAEVRSLTPVPCCPAHIAGLMTLRGDLITLVDIASTLGLTPLHDWVGRKIVVPNRTELGVGVIVDDVLDVFTLPPIQLAAAHAAPRLPNQEYLQGVVPYGAQMLRLLDLPALLMQQNLIINENP